MTMIKVLLFISCIFPIAHAEVITDGSLGAKIELSGKNFQITPELGQQFGGNLFHSFQSFNLNSDESATFSGADSVQNIISRVTGGSPSHLNGLIRSTIPNADLYFLNPYGIMFGQNAKLDLQGGFHASTADYLKLQDGGRFDARQLNNSLLSVAPVTSFGFLETPNSIQIQDSQLTAAPRSELSLVGGDLTLNHAQLTAESGQINLVSVASTGELTTKEARISDTLSFSQLGQIKITDSQVETSGSPAGGISIRGGQFLMTNSLLHAHNYGTDPGVGIDIELHDLMSVRVEDTSGYQQADHNEAFGITSDTLATGKAGHVAISVPRLEMRQNTIDVSTKGDGEGGNINIQTQQIFLGEGAEILSNSYSSGAGGEINIKATERLEMKDQRVFATEEEADNNHKTLIQANSLSSGNGGYITINTPYLGMIGSYIFSNNAGQGHGGTIIINSQFMELLNGSVITATVFPQGIGDGGEIKLYVSDTLKLSGFRPGFVRESIVITRNPQSGIGSSTIGLGNASSLEITAKNLILGYATIASATVGYGNAGSLMIAVDNLHLQDGGILTNSSGVFIGGQLWFATGNGGHLTVVAKENIIIEGQSPFNPSSIATNTFLSGQGGSIHLQANRLILRDGGTLSANSLSGTGNAGDIHIKANEIHLSNGGEITSAAMQAIGGNIDISAKTLIYLQNSQMTTSVSGGVGDGGNISIDNPQFLVLNHAQIKAQADAGHGGNINLIAQHFIPSADSLISASSNLGIDGQILIQSPTEDVGNQVLNLSANFLNASALLPLSCAARIVDQRPSQFTRPFTLILKPHILGDAPEDIHASQLANHN